MTREEVYDKCVEKIYPTLEAYEDGIYSVKQLLPDEARGTGMTRKEAIKILLNTALEREEEEECD